MTGKIPLFLKQWRTTNRSKGSWKNKKDYEKENERSKMTCTRITRRMMTRRRTAIKKK